MSNDTLFPEQDTQKPADTTEQFVQQLKTENAELKQQLSQVVETQNALKELMAELRTAGSRCWLFT